MHIYAQVLESDTINFLFGLDTLRRYNCIVDLGRNVLRISNGVNTYEDLPFLGDGEMEGVDDVFNGQQSQAGSSSATSAAINNGAVGADRKQPGHPQSIADVPTSSVSQSTPMHISEDAHIPTTTHTVPTAHATSATTATVAQASDNEAKVQQLVALGFSEAQARMTLIHVNGDVDMAAALLFEQS